ncbi:MAG: 2-amino-4-hydroxy-6-hydroxymethyldihydropteridine diphosphokinase [Alistipes sp.]
MPRVVILTGGNIGDVKSRLQHAQQLINERVGAVLRCSHRYQTEPWGFATEEAGNFSNQVLEISTDLQSEAVLDALQQIEQELGRDRNAESRERERTGERYSSRKIDIDMLFYGDEVISTERLTIPHPLMAEREFVLNPLCEILRSKRHPVTGKTAGEMLEELKTKR